MLLHLRLQLVLRVDDVCRSPWAGGAPKGGGDGGPSRGGSCVAPCRPLYRELNELPIGAEHQVPGI